MVTFHLLRDLFIIIMDIISYTDIVDLHVWIYDDTLKSLFFVN